MGGCFYKHILPVVGLVTCFFCESKAVVDSTCIDSTGLVHVYKVGLPHIPTIMYRNSSGVPTGFAVELLQHILDDENIKYEWVDGSWSSLFEKLKQGEIDILPGTQVSAERKVYFDFLDHRIYTMWSELYIKKDVRLNGLNDLVGKRIGLVENDNNGISLIDYVARFDIKFTPVWYKSHDEAIQALLNNDIYGMAGPSPTFFSSIADDISPSGLFYNPSDLNVGFTKGKHSKLIKRMDKRLISYIHDNHSIYYQLISKYDLLHPDSATPPIPLWARVSLISLIIFMFFGALFLFVLRHRVKVKTQRLRENELLLAKVLELGEMGSWQYNIITKQFLWSKELYAIAGYSTTTTISDVNSNVLINIHISDRERVIKTLDDAIKTGSSIDCEFRAIVKDGKVINLRTIGVVVADSSGKSQQMIGICQNITSIKEHEQMLMRALESAEKSERLKSAFLANMSHEIRTPLNSIVGFSSLLNGKTLRDEKRIVYSGIIVSQSNILLTLINDIIDLAKIEAGVMSVSISSNVNVQSFMSEIYTGHRLLCPSHINFILKVLPECKGIDITIDEIRVRQIVSNFISNAFKYADAGNVTLGVRLQEANNRIELFVKDSGPGISDDEKAIIFDRFRKLQEGGQGTGLGLAIARSLAELMDADIYLNSAAGQGSEFVLSLKL